MILIGVPRSARSRPERSIFHLALHTDSVRSVAGAAAREVFGVNVEWPQNRFGPGGLQWLGVGNGSRPPCLSLWHVDKALPPVSPKAGRQPQRSLVSRQQHLRSLYLIRIWRRHYLSFWGIRMVA